MTTPETFAELFEASLANTVLEPGQVIKARVMEVHPDNVIVNANLKSDAVISKAEFRDEEINVGDEVDVYIDSIENGYGETRLSREKAIHAAEWLELEALKDQGTTVLGTIIERVKGGFTVRVKSLSAFLPGSLVDVKPVRDPGYLEGKEQEFKIIKMDKRRNNIVVSRRAVLEGEGGADRASRLEELQEGQELMGVVKNITDYGAFVDLGGADGLLHITDMSWKRVKHPGEVLTVGQEINVKILKFDREKNRVSLGLKQMGEDPWVNIARRYPIGTRLFGKVTNVTDYGCFVEIEDGVEGLVHMSELDWTNKNIHPNKVVQPNQEVEVMVLDINEERRRVSLGVKQCKVNPWLEFSEKHKKDQRVKGNIRSITDFGIFIGLDGEIDGLIHLSDISWSEPGEVAVRNFKKGDEVEAVILGIDSERERISLGIKQLEADPVADFMAAHKPDEIHNAKVIELEPKRALLELAENVHGSMRANDYGLDRIDDLTKELKLGEMVEVKVVGDRRGRELYVSNRATMQADMASIKTQAGEATATLGDLLKDQINKDGE